MASHTLHASLNDSSTSFLICDQTVSAEGLKIRWDRACGIAFYVGTRAQLEDEGVVPKGVLWPQRGDTPVRWMRGGLNCELFRVRPAGHRGAWATLDHWRVHVVCSAERIARLRVGVAAQNLIDEIHHGSAAGQRESAERWSKLFRARDDVAFSEFMSHLPGLVPARRGRRALVEGVQ